MLLCICIGIFSGFVFLSVLLFCVRDLERVNTARIGPLLQIFLDATGNSGGSIALLIFPLGCMVFTSTALMTTSSRMSYAFARDGGLPFSKAFAKVHPTLDVPLNALLWTTAWVVIFGLIFLGSTSTFNAITAASVVALGVTYAIPPAINVLQGRKKLPADRAFKIPEPWGWVLNLVSFSSWL
jgi:choline transport protein